MIGQWLDPGSRTFPPPHTHTNEHCFVADQRGLLGLEVPPDCTRTESVTNMRKEKQIEDQVTEVALLSP